MHTPVNELVMSPTAVILCFAILASLACVAVLVYFPYATYFKGLPGDVDTLASIIALIYDSFQVFAAQRHSKNDRVPTYYSSS